MRHYSDHDDSIEIDTVTIDGQDVTVVTIYQDIINEWYGEGLERAVIHIVDDTTDSKFL